MRLLVELDRQGSVSGAARVVGITQSTASEHLRVLEVPPDRDCSSAAAVAAASPRPAGRFRPAPPRRSPPSVLARRSWPSSPASRRARSTSARLDPLCVYLLPDTLGCFRADYPQVKVEAEIAASDEILRRLLAGHLQRSPSSVHQPRPRAESSSSRSSPTRSAAAKPGLLRVEHVGAAALSEVMLLARLGRVQALADQELARAGIEPAGRWEPGSSEAVKRSASARARRRLPLPLRRRRGRGRPPSRAPASPAGRRSNVSSVARPHRTALSPGERAFIETLTRCCATNADYATACVG